MSTARLFASLAATLATFGSLAGTANGAFTLIVSEYTSSAITFSVSGSFDADTFGDRNPGILLLAPGTNLTVQWYNGTLAVDSSSLTVGGNPHVPIGWDNGSDTGDSVYWVDSFTVIPAGTVVGGSARLTGSFFNSFSATDFKLYSGLAVPGVANRLEATAVPEPSAVLLLSGAAACALARRRRTC